MSTFAIKSDHLVLTDDVDGCGYLLVRDGLFAGVTKEAPEGVEIVDRTENMGAESVPLMQLYHMNFGWPLISETTRLVAPEHKVAARDAAAVRMGHDAAADA